MATCTCMPWTGTQLPGEELISVGGQTAVLGEAIPTRATWVTFPISVAAGETVPIVVDRTAGANAVLSGIFLG